MSKKPKLELTWIGKENRARLEPRILLEDRERSHHAAHRVSDQDLFDNRLIFGDNLLALKALEQEFAGKVKCVFIDPPYNTGSAFTHYDDGVEHSIWLSLMRDRLEMIRQLLSDDGSLWITIDDTEAHYLKVLCDEIFGRPCFVSNVIWEKADSPRNSARQFSTDHDHVLIFSRNPDWLPARLARTDAANSIYANPDEDSRGHLSHEQLQQLSDEVGESRSLLVVCSAFRGRKDGYPNLTVKKIPAAVLGRCEWGKDDYSLRVENLPKAPPPAGQQGFDL